MTKCLHYRRARPRTRRDALRFQRARPARPELGARGARSRPAEPRRGGGESRRGGGRRTRRGSTGPSSRALHAQLCSCPPSPASPPLGGHSLQPGPTPPGPARPPSTPVPPPRPLPGAEAPPTRGVVSGGTRTDSHLLGRSHRYHRRAAERGSVPPASWPPTPRWPESGCGHARPAAEPRRSVPRQAQRRAGDQVRGSQAGTPAPRVGDPSQVV